MLGPVRVTLRGLQTTLETDVFGPSASSREFAIAVNHHVVGAVIPTLDYRVKSDLAAVLARLPGRGRRVLRQCRSSNAGRYTLAGG